MKRITVLTVAAAVLALALATKALAQASSVPNTINFQGKLTDNAGNPVADGPHNFTFRIFDNIFSVTPLWTEGPLAVTTTGGLLNHQLGSGTPLPQTLFTDYPELYLEIEVDGEVQTPRIQFISTPYTRVAGGLEVRRTNNDTVVIRTIPDAHQLSTYGTDGKEQIRLWGPTYGEILLHDADVTNDQTVRLRANSSSGGELHLTDDNAVITINLHGGLIGDASVIVPNNAINALEVKDEPGVASNLNSTTIIPLGGAVQTVLSRSITVPASGWVLAIGTLLSGPASGSTAFADFGVSDVAGVFPPNQNVRMELSSGVGAVPITVHGLFSVGAGASTFYLLADELAGEVFVGKLQLTLVYFPTAYGTVVPTVTSAGKALPDENLAASSALTSVDIAAEQTEAGKFNAERIIRELAQVKAEMEARMQKLEEQLQQNQKAEENEQ